MVSFAEGVGGVGRLRGCLFAVRVWIEGICFVTGIADTTRSLINSKYWSKNDVEGERDYRPLEEYRRVFRAFLRFSDSKLAGKIYL